jgi:hypothetical protein
MLFLESCKEDAYFTLKTRDVDWNLDSKNVIDKQIVDIDLLGANDLYVFDSLLLITGNNPAAQLKVYSTNSFSLLGSFCSAGRAKNEFNNPVNNGQQFYRNSKNEIIFPFIDNRFNVKEVNISQSLVKNSTLVDESVQCLDLLRGNFQILDNDINRTFENVYGARDKNDLYTASKYYIKSKDGEIEKELNVFPEVLKFTGITTYIPYYIGAIYKHPEKNIIVQPLQYMNYLLYFDLDNEKYFAVHKKGSLSFDDDISSFANVKMCFGSASVTSEYIFVIYDLNDDRKDPEMTDLLVFDWNGNKLAELKLNAYVYRIAFDEIHSKLYGLGYSEGNTDEGLFSFDFNELMSSLNK